ncbi:MAG TPA: hypothetical protein DCQ92_13595 [Verrucomicrobia subdivision 3 bacterium]|nr:hypothetical protein [Limisphaerales bacterium]
MFESLVKLCRRFLQLHSRPQTVRRLGATPDEAVNLFLDVDGRLFHGVFRISCDAGQSKDTENGLRDNLLIGFYLSFSDKKDLTNGIDWFILCAMNANEISTKASPRLNRIQKISRILKVCVLFYFVVPLCVVAFNLKSLHLATGMVSIFNHPYASAADIPKLMYLFGAIGTCVYLLGVISFYRLLCLYEKGVIFSEANVSEMKKLGSYLAGYGILAVAANVVYMGGIVFPWVLLEGVASPWIVVGGAIYIVAWIMDEGRKIQEEQELTV